MKDLCSGSSPTRASSRSTRIAGDDHRNRAWNFVGVGHVVRMHSGMRRGWRRSLEPRAERQWKKKITVKENGRTNSHLVDPCRDHGFSDPHDRRAPAGSGYGDAGGLSGNILLGILQRSFQFFDGFAVKHNGTSRQKKTDFWLAPTCVGYFEQDHACFTLDCPRLGNLPTEGQRYCELSRACPDPQPLGSGFPQSWRGIA